MKGCFVLIGLLALVVLVGCVGGDDMVKLGSDMERYNAINELFKNDPVQEISMLISKLVDMPGTWKETEKITSESKSSIRARSIAEKTALREEQICMGRGDFINHSDWDYVSGADQKIMYNGTQAKVLKAGVVCSRNGKAELESYLKNTVNVTGDDYIKLEECNCSVDICCAVILMKT